MSDQFLPPDEPPERGRPTRVPPHNIAAEEAVLGAMLLSREAIADAIEIVTADDLSTSLLTRKYLTRSHHCLQRGSRLTS